MNEKIKQEFLDKYTDGFGYIVDSKADYVWQFIEEKLEQARKEAVEGFIDYVWENDNDGIAYDEVAEAYLKSISSPKP